jgi:hypothetical protein
MAESTRQQKDETPRELDQLVNDPDSDREPAADRDVERERIRSSNDRDQELEREGVTSRHNRGYDEAASQPGGQTGATDPDSAASDIDRDDTMVD